MKGDGLWEVKVTEAALNAKIQNQGAITADGGRVVMNAKTANDLMHTVINQNGVVKAQSLVERNGEIILDGGDNGTVAVSGTLDTQGTQGGNINVTGKAVELASTAVVDASGTQQGGNVNIGDLQHTEQVTLKQDSTVNANVTDNGKAGNIKVLANLNTGQTHVHGNLNAKAPKQGDGGFIETSGATVKIADTANISTKAAQGTSGTWLIDPTDFNIGGVNSDISGAALGTQIDNQKAVVIQSTQGKTGSNGDINVNEAVTWSTTFGLLVLKALHNININADITGIKLWLNYGQATADGSGSGYFINNGAKVNLAAGRNFVTTQGTSGILKEYTVITDLGVERDKSTTTLQGMQNKPMSLYALGANIDASSAANWASARVTGFNPIGDPNNKFVGELHGLGHYIANLSINDQGSSFTIQGPLNNLITVDTSGYIGLFSVLGQNAVVRDLQFKQASIKSIAPFVGTLAGNDLGAKIDNVTVTGSNIQGTDAVGGIVGISHSTINNAYVGSSTITGRGFRVGGIAGVLTTAGSINNSYTSESTISALSTVGGLVGYLENNASINNSYSNSTVKFSGTDTNAAGAGALVGQTTINTGVPTINNSFWNTDIANGLSAVGNTAYGTPTLNNVVGKTTAELQTLSTFTNAGWDIDNQGGTGKVWRIYEGYTTPLLRVFMKPMTIEADNISKTYNGLADSGLQNPTYTPENLLSRFAVQNKSDPYNGAKNVGVYTPGLWSTQFGVDIKLIGGTLTINKAPLSIYANNASKTYDGTAYTGGNGVSYSSNPYFLSPPGFVNGETESVLGGTLVYSGNSQNAINAGVYDIFASGLTSNNYDISYKTGTLSILSAPLTITPNDLHKLQGLPYFFDGTEYKAIGLVNGETLGSVMLASDGASSKAKVSGSPYDIYPISISGGTANLNNYYISYNTGKFYVEPNPLSNTIIGGILDNAIVTVPNPVLGAVGQVANIADITFVRLGNSNNFKLVNSSNPNATFSESQLSRILSAYRVFGYIVADEIGSITNPLKTSTTEYLDSYNTPSARADDILKRFEEVDPDFGQFKHSIYQTKLLGYGRYKELGKERWSEKKHQDKQQLKQHYDNLYFIIEGDGVKLPEGSVVSSNTKSNF